MQSNRPKVRLVTKMSLEVTPSFLVYIALLALMNILLLFSCLIKSNSLQSHGLQHARLPCSSLSSSICLNSCPLVMLSNYLMLCHALFLLPSIFPSIRVLFNEPVLCISSFQLSHSVKSDSLQPHEPQHARPPCPSPTPGVPSNSSPLSQ